jgi:hypothetical protein
MPAGRPTDYKPEYCDLVLQWGRDGKSKAWMAAELDVTRQTLENWEKAHPEFLDAITRAMLKSQQWWEDKGQTGITLQGFGASVWSRSMAARFPDDWREKTETKQTVDLTYGTKDQRDATVAAAFRADT